MSLLRTKSIEQSIADTDEPEYKLKKTLSALDLTVFGVGVVIGAGIFTLTGRAAHNVAGPSIVVSFVIAAFCCALAAMCYAEFASTVPVSGSAYTFSYAALGEIFAWIIGWDLILEMFLGASVVAQGWSAYLGVFLGKIGITTPAAISYGGHVDVFAMGLVVVLGVLVTFGIKESLRVNLVLVGVKLFIVLFVIFAGLQFINTANYAPFVPGGAGDGDDDRLDPAAAPDAHRCGAVDVRHRRHRGRRGAGVLRVHRLRRGGHHRRGDQEPAARPADRHHRVAGDLHGPVLRGRPRGDRHGPVQRARSEGGPRQRVRPPRPVLDGDADLGRRRRGPDHRRPHADDRRDPPDLRHVPRRAAADGPGEGAPDVPHPVADHRDRHGDRRRRRRSHAHRACSRRW